MKEAVFSFTIMLAALTLQAVQGDTSSYLKLSNVTLDQIKRNQDVVVTYSLENNGEPAYVFLDILTNGISIGRDKIMTVSGDITVTNNFVTEGNKTITWKARNDWRGNLASNAKACVYAYYTNDIVEIPGIYMVIDLSGGSAATSYPVSYTVSVPAVNDENRTTKLWLRRIEPGTFLMGSTDATDPAYRESNNEIQHEVTLTHAFFAGVFEVTAKQYKLVTGTVPSGENGDQNLCAANMVSFDDIRGNITDSSSYDWPGSSDVNPASFIGLLRTKTGISQFDLPTEAQWEYACRAGTAGAWNNGTTITNKQYDANLALLGWFGNSTAIGTGNAKGMKPVGLKLPNAWGLYDMHGNACEWCLDWYVEDLTTLVTQDPKGPASGDCRIDRSGSWCNAAYRARSAFRHWDLSSRRDTDIGFRLFRTLP